MVNSGNLKTIPLRAPLKLLLYIIGRVFKRVVEIK